MTKKEKKALDNKRYYDNNKEKFRKNSAKKYRENSDWHHQYYEKNKDKIGKYQKDRRESMKGDYKVYVMIDSDYIIQYIGMTKTELKLRYQYHCAAFKTALKTSFIKCSNPFYKKLINPVELSIVLYSTTDTKREALDLEKELQSEMIGTKTLLEVTTCNKE